jgi:glycerol-3-phosphate acyltransferase PlsX
MIIAVDASGGDHAPHEIVKGAIKAAEDYGVEIALVGNKSILHVQAARHLKQGKITIVDAPETIDFGESPVKAVRTKLNSSIVVGINLVKEGAASAFVSAGSSGAVVMAALFNLGTIEGIERPPLASLISINPVAPVLLIDSGVNIDCRPNHLVQFAQLGTIYARYIMGIETPRVGLLNNGEEESKGNRLAVEGHQLLKQTPDIKFIGNLEGQEILKGKADIIVTDGFTGNVVIKTIEGLGDTFLLSLLNVGQLISSAYNVKGRIFLKDIGLSSWVSKMDYQEYGGACLLGVNGNVIVAHGRSQAKAIKNAISLARQTAEQDLARMIKEKANIQKLDGNNSH